MSDSDLRIGIVGTGRLGASLAAVLARAGYSVTAVSGRDVQPRGPVSSCDLVFLCVPDGAIASVAERLTWRDGQYAVHCSGAMGLDVLAAARPATPGCLHPIQSFPSREPEPDRFLGIVCGIEGDPGLAAILEDMAGRMGARTVSLEGVDRALYHAAAVFASNYVVALMSAATRAWAFAGLPEDSAREALAPLLRAVAANVSAMDLPDALTGPISRGDSGTVAAHLDALARDPSLADLYRLLAHELVDVAHLDAATRGQMLSALRSATDDR